MQSAIIACMDSRNVNISISTGTILTTLLFIVLIGVLYVLRDTVLVVLTAVVLAASIEPVTRYLMKFKMPRVVSVVIIYVGILISLFSLFYFLLPPLVQDANALLSELPSRFESLSGVFGDQALFGEGDETEISFLESLRELGSTLNATSGGLFQTVTAVFGGLLSFILIIVLSFYFAVQEKGIDEFLKLITPHKHQTYVLDLWQRSQHKIGLWMQGQIMLSLIVMILVYLCLSILQVPYALLLAVLAGIFELIPVFGSILAAVPAVGVAFITGGTGLALMVVGAYVIINQFQGNLIYPLVVQKVVGVPPLLVILSLIIGGQLAGFMGILLSVPVAATLREFVADIQRDREEKNLTENV